MKTIKFDCKGHSAPAYSCNKPYDNSGEYVPAEVAQGLYDALVQARSELEEIALAEIGERYLNFDINAALAAADSDERITLEPGDYVSTEGMTEEQYHAVALAFLVAGAKEGGREPLWDRYPLMGWDARDNMLYAHIEDLSECWTGRHLTIDQVLGATNANTQPEAQPEPNATPNPITTLLTARKARDEAEVTYRVALEEAREFIGDGFELTEVGTDAPLVDGEDMTDPVNWRAGDVVECVEPGCDLTVGKFYTVEKVLGSTDIRLVCDDNDDHPVRMPQKFRFHHRHA